MSADAIGNVIRRYSSMIDTSGAEPPRAIQMVPMLGGGVYTSGGIDPQQDGEADPLTGRISLGILAAFVAGAVAFYVWTNGIQGGG
jgi:hypothetical protein